MAIFKADDSRIMQDVVDGPKTTKCKNNQNEQNDRKRNFIILLLNKIIYTTTGLCTLYMLLHIMRAVSVVVRVINHYIMAIVRPRRLFKITMGRKLDVTPRWPCVSLVVDEKVSYYRYLPIT